MTGPVRDIVADPAFLDVTVPPGARFGVKVREGYTVFAYVIGGSGVFDGSGAAVNDHDLILFSDGERVLATAIGTIPFRFLLLSGKPIREPIAWRGPIVMNTDEELRLAFQEYRDGTFVRAAKG